jgi:TonB family protein
MKKLFLYFVFAVLWIHSAAQSSKEEVYTITEEMPEYPGGSQEMMTYLQKNITYPANSREKKLGGKVYVKFIVDTDGKIKDAHVLRGSGIAAMDDEALRVINSMPAWKPGKMSNKAVPVYFNLPISFSIADPYCIADPYFVFNTNNKNENYLNAKKLIEAGDTKGAMPYLTANDLKNDLDALYNLGVIYFWQRDKANSCKCFNAVIEECKDKQSTILVNSQKFGQYCN